MVEIKAGGEYRSYSALTSWLSCGKAFALSRIAKVNEQPAWWFAGGSAVHTATEWFDIDLYERTGA